MPVKASKITPRIRDILRNVRDYHFDLRFSGILKNVYNIRLDQPKSFDDRSTAYWYCTKRPCLRHTIVLSMALEKNADKKPRPPLDDYYIAHYKHEISHAEWTNRMPLQQFKRKYLDPEGIPFHLFNLFEDARIEHIWRQTFKEKFNWLKFEEIKAPLSIDNIGDYGTAQKTFFEIIQCEGEVEKYLPNIWDKNNIYIKYYSQAISARNQRI